MNTHNFLPSAGAHVLWYASRFRWDLKRYSIFVEGDTDEKYLRHANTLYRQKYGLSLLGERLTVIAVGSGSAGGTDGVKENLPPLWKIIREDCHPSGKPAFRVILLLDNDPAGRKTCSYLTDRYTALNENKDVFRLHRILPRDSQEPRRISDLIRSANEPWKDLDCEIEDLLNEELVLEFLKENPGSLLRESKRQNGQSHFDFTIPGKSNLCRWVLQNAVNKDLDTLAEILKSLRYFLGLEPDGDVCDLSREK